MGINRSAVGCQSDYAEVANQGDFDLRKEKEISTEELKDYDGVLFAGQGALAYQDTLIEELGDRAHFAPPHLMEPSPASLAHLGLIHAEEGLFVEPSTLTPLYLRKSEAEIKHG